MQTLVHRTNAGIPCFALLKLILDEVAGLPGGDLPRPVAVCWVLFGVPILSQVRSSLLPTVADHGSMLVDTAMSATLLLVVVPLSALLERIVDRMNLSKSNQKRTKVTQAIYGRTWRQTTHRDVGLAGRVALRDL
jgi:hypothetical protein